MESSGSNKTRKETARHSDSFSVDLDQLKGFSVNRQADAPILEIKLSLWKLVLVRCCCYCSVISTQDSACGS
jgi:hypothetical protein